MFEHFFEPKETNPDVAVATEELKRLQDESASLPNALRVASNNADSKTMIRLSTRKNELPFHIYSAQVRLSKVRITALQAEKREAQKKHTEASREMGLQVQLIQQQINDAEQLARDLHIKKSNYQMSEQASYGVVADVQIRIERAEKELRLLINKQANDEPVIDQVYESGDVAMMLRSGFGQTNRPDQPNSSAVVAATGHVEMPAGLRPLTPGESIRIEYQD